MTFGVMSPMVEMPANTLDVMLLGAITEGTDHPPRSGESAVTQEQPVRGGPVYSGPAPGVVEVEDIYDEVGTLQSVRTVAEARRVEAVDIDELSGLVSSLALDEEVGEVEIASSYGDVQSLGSVEDLDVFDLEQGESSDPPGEWITVTRRKPARGNKCTQKPLEPLSETELGLSAPVGWVERRHAARQAPVKVLVKRVEPARKLIPFGQSEPLLTTAQRMGKVIRGGRRWVNPQVSSQINGSQGECTGTDDLPAHTERFRSAAAEVNRGSGSRSKVAKDASPTDSGIKEARRYEDKQRPCFKFSVGTCRFADGCKYSHEASMDSEASKPQGYKPCRDFASGVCTRGASCRFSHSIGKSPSSFPDVKKPREVVDKGEATSDPDPPKTKQEPKVPFKVWATELLRERAVREEVEEDSVESSDASTSGSETSRLTPQSNSTLPGSGEESETEDSQSSGSVSSLGTDGDAASDAASSKLGPEITVGKDFPRQVKMPDLERQFTIFGQLGKTEGKFIITLDEAESFVMGESGLGVSLAEIKQKADFLCKIRGGHKLLALLGTGWMKPGLAGLNGPAVTPFFDMYEIKLSHFRIEVEWRVTQDLVLQTEDSRSANKTHVTMVAGADMGSIVVGMVLLLPRACPDAPCPHIDWFSGNGTGLSRFYSSVLGLVGSVSATCEAMHREREEIEGRWARAQTSFSRQPGNLHWLTGADCPSHTLLYRIDRSVVLKFGYYAFERDGFRPPSEYNILPFIGSTWSPLMGVSSSDVQVLLNDPLIGPHTDDVLWAFGCVYQREALSLTLVHNHAHAAMTVTDPLSLRSVCACVNNNAAYNIPGNGMGISGSQVMLSLVGCEALSLKPARERAKWRGGAAL